MKDVTERQTKTYVPLIRQLFLFFRSSLIIDYNPVESLHQDLSEWTLYHTVNKNIQRRPNQLNEPAYWKNVFHFFKFLISLEGQYAGNEVNPL